MFVYTVSRAHVPVCAGPWVLVYSRFRVCPDNGLCAMGSKDTSVVAFHQQCSTCGVAVLASHACPVWPHPCGILSWGKVVCNLHLLTAVFD